MPIEFICQQCRRPLRTPDESAGKTARCPACGSVQPIPFKSDAAAALGAGSAPPESKSPAERETPNRFGDDASTPAGPGFAPLQKPKATAGAATSFNPYAPPAHSAAFHPAVPNLEYARNRVRAPATLLMIVSGIALVFSMIAVAAYVAMILQGDAEPAGMIQLGISLPLAVFVLYGANKMRRLEQYGVALAAACCALLPCSGCCILGLPCGIWALVVLSDPHVKSAFR